MENQILFYNPAQQGVASRQQNYWAPHPMTFRQPTNAQSAPSVHIQDVQPADAGAMFGFHSAHGMSQLASPQPTYLQQQPAVLGQERISPMLRPLEVDMSNWQAASRGETATPPLTRSHSINNTPSPQSATLDWHPETPTLLSTRFDEEFNGVEGVKPGCERDVFDEVLASTEFHQAEMHELMLSSPLTPSMPGPVPQHPPANREGSYLLTTDNCPALSPSPVTSVAQTPFRPGALGPLNGLVGTCNPRHLTKDDADTAAPNPSPCLPALPLPPFLDDDAAAPAEAEQPITTSTEPTFNFPTCLDGCLEELPQSIPPTDNANYLGSKRQRLSTSVESPVGFEDSDAYLFDSTILSHSAEDMSRQQSTQSFSTEADAERTEDQTQNTNEQPQSTDANQQAASATSDANPTAAPSASANNAMAPAPSRRGRKQSFTDDPSKQYACDKCSRRFRRQEHLKRHIRSLHSNEKPFPCPECGKKFSRSDNLSQHQRTHGTNSVTMEVLDNAGIQYRGDGYGNHDPAQLGNSLFTAANNVSSSSSPDSSDFEHYAGRKRRRDE